ncbi:MAG: hypothetical protein F6K22_08980 [Okeania sp. SIO2F4]|uniref:hypothetical protein n=1 Tax=Okeania sp. SIO2F4 TaxID=2607790 RepID=UPI00142C87AB|nr:hypothetical protein [Okeania sp. SIO2F4]NES02967.1 hypothetical protein [Okeania sp. SIO2F4]
MKTLGTGNYITPGEYSKRSEATQGRIRRNNLTVLELKEKQSQNLVTAEQVKLQASQYKIPQAQALLDKEIAVTRKNYHDAQKAKVDAVTAGVNVRIAQQGQSKAQIELSYAQVDNRLTYLQRQAQLTGKAMDLSNLLSQNSEKSALLSMQGRLIGQSRVVTPLKSGL